MSVTTTYRYNDQYNLATFKDTMQSLKREHAETVQLIGCALTDTEIFELCQHLSESHKPIRCLYLTRCNLGDGNLSLILQVIPRSLQVLSLWWNDLSDKCLPALCAAMDRCPDLHQIDLYGNYRNTYIYPLIHTTHRSLRTVGLGSTGVLGLDRDTLRARLRTTRSLKARCLITICSTHNTRLGKVAAIRLLPRDLIRHLALFF